MVFLSELPGIFPGAAVDGAQFPFFGRLQGLCMNAGYGTYADNPDF
jgi:hypothetical protein